MYTHVYTHTILYTTTMMIKGLLQLERVMVYAKAYYFFKVC